MRYTLRRRLSRTWLAAWTALALAALALAALVAATPGDLILLGTERPADDPAGAMPRATHHLVDHAADQPEQPAPASGPASRAAAPPPLTVETVLGAFNCARQRAQLPPYQHDPALDREAESLLQHALRDADQHLDGADYGYTLTGQLLLDSEYPLELERSCGVGGFDVGQVQDLDQAERIGIAVAAVPNAYQRPLYQAIVVGR